MKKFKLLIISDLDFFSLFYLNAINAWVLINHPIRKDPLKNHL